MSAQPTSSWCRAPAGGLSSATGALTWRCSRKRARSGRPAEEVDGDQEGQCEREHEAEREREGIHHELVENYQCDRIERNSGTDARRADCVANRAASGPRRSRARPPRRRGSRSRCSRSPTAVGGRPAPNWFFQTTCRRRCRPFGLAGIDLLGKNERAPSTRNWPFSWSRVRLQIVVAARTSSNDVMSLRITRGRARSAMPHRLCGPANLIVRGLKEDDEGADEGEHEDEPNCELPATPGPPQVVHDHRRASSVRKISAHATLRWSRTHTAATLRPKPVHSRRPRGRRHAAQSNTAANANPLTKKSTKLSDSAVC